MDSRQQLFSPGRQILFFILQLIIFIFCVWYIQFIYYLDILPDKQVRESYLATNCTVLQEKISTQTGLGNSYRADFLVNYSINGMSYQAWVSGNGLNRSFTSDRASQSDILTQFNMGSNYPCWFNPQNPKIVVLVLRHSWTSTFPLLIPCVIGLITLFYLSINLFELLNFFLLRLRKE